MSTTPTDRRRSRGFSLSLSINNAASSSSPSPSTMLSRRQSFASVFMPSSSSPTPSTPGRFKRALKRIGSIRMPSFRRRSSSNASGGWGWGVGDSDYVYDDDMDVSYEGLLRLAARIGDAKPKNLPSQFKSTLPRGVYGSCEAAQADDRCAICLDKYQDDDPVMGITECGHYFHNHCFDTWLDLASNCPVCRRELTPADYVFDPNSPASSPTSPISLNSYFGSASAALPPIPHVVLEETASRTEDAWAREDVDDEEEEEEEEEADEEEEEADEEEEEEERREVE